MPGQRIEDLTKPIRLKIRNDSASPYKLGLVEIVGEKPGSGEPIYDVTQVVNIPPKPAKEQASISWGQAAVGDKLVLMKGDETDWSKGEWQLRVPAGRFQQVVQSGKSISEGELIIHPVAICNYLDPELLVTVHREIAFNRRRPGERAKSGSYDDWPAIAWEPGELFRLWGRKQEAPRGKALKLDCFGLRLVLEDGATTVVAPSLGIRANGELYGSFSPWEPGRSGWQSEKLTDVLIILRGLGLLDPAEGLYTTVRVGRKTYLSSAPSQKKVFDVDMPWDFPKNKVVEVRWDDEKGLWVLFEGSETGEYLPPNLAGAVANHPAWRGSEPEQSFAGWAATSQDLSFIRTKIRAAMEAAASEGFVGEDLAAKDRTFKRGYNVLKMKPEQPSEYGTTTQTPLFAPMNYQETMAYSMDNGYRVPLDMVPEETVKNIDKRGQTFVYCSEAQRVEAQSLTIGLTGSAKGVELGGGYSQTKSNSTSLSSTSMTAATYIYGYKFWLTPAKTLVRLSPGFLASLNNVFEDAPTPDHPRRYHFVKTLIFDKYGTHYPLHMLVGAMMKQTLRMDSNTFSKAIEKSEGFNAKAGAKGASLDFGKSINSLSSDSETMSHSTESLVRVGGEGATPEAFDIGPPLSWMPIKVHLRPISEVLRPELIPIGSKYDTLEFATKLHNLRLQMPLLLQQYLEEGAKFSKCENPVGAQAIDVKFVSFKVKERDGGEEPDQRGKLQLQVSEKDEQNNYTVCKDWETLFERKEEGGKD